MRMKFTGSSGIFLAILSLLFFSFTSFAQQTITGKVTDAKTGAPLSGVNVAVKGTKAVAQSGADGTFRISSPSSGGVLVFTYVGFDSKEMPFNVSTISISVSLQAVEKLGENVVVVAYGTRRKADLTGAVAQVGVKEFQKGNINSSEQLLVGKVAGLEVTTGGGSAGGGSKIRIRGGASLNASNDPLIVIDGVPVESNGVAGSPNILNTINPDDIESISVLKDASATALYGSRASNGVLIVTTKRGSRGKMKLNFNTQFSLSKVSDKINVLSGDQIREIVNADAAATGNNAWKNLLGTANTDWQDQIYRTAFGNNNNISVSGFLPVDDNEKTKIPFRLSLGSTYQEGILKTDKFSRFSMAMNMTPKLINDNLTLNINAKYSHTAKRFADEGAIGAAVAFDPTKPVYSGSGAFGGYWEWLQPDGRPIDLATRNPLALLDQRRNESDVYRFIGNVQLDYRIRSVEGLHVQANLGMDNTKGMGKDLIDSASATNYRTLGRETLYNNDKNNWLADLGLFYEKELKSVNGKIDFLAAHSYQDFSNLVRNYAAYGMDGNIIPTSIPAFSKDRPRYRLESYLGRMNLNLYNKYLLTASVRSDASSKFSSDNRTGIFPAAAFAWKLNDEFFKSSKAISELKLRLGWGITGQQDGIGYYTYLPVYNQSSLTAQYLFGNTYYTFLRPSAYDKNIKWETTTTINAGLDFGFAKNRITGMVDVYMKKTKDLLSVVPVAPGSNFDITLLTNVGNIENKGVEVSINTIPVRNSAITWEFGFNVTYNKTEITNLLRQQDPSFSGIDVSGISGGTGNNIGKFAIGYAPYAYFVYKQVYDNNGKPIEGLYEDLNRDGRIDDGDRYLYKKPAPDFMYGINTNLTYKNFSIGMAGHGMAGNYLYNNYNSGNAVLRNIQNPIQFVSNASGNYLETRFSNNQYLSDYYIENASFFRIDNINLGYNMGAVISPNTNLRVSANVQNVLVITKYTGADPENASSTGVDNNIYPRPRIFSIGANLDF